MRFTLAIAALGICVALTAGQNTRSGQEGGNAPATIRSNVQLVTIPVIVRDKDGSAVGGLNREDFQLFDNGKRQEVSLFSVEKPEGPIPPASVPRAPEPAAVAIPRAAQRPAATPGSDMVPTRYVAYLFDDIHMKASDLMRVRKAAAAHFDSALRPGDRGAVYTTSGVITVEFTSDRDELKKALTRLAPRPLRDENPFACPQISYYHADLILNRKDPQAIRAALGELMACEPSLSGEQAVNRVNFEARAPLIEGERESKVTLASAHDVVRHMEVLPGQRILIFVSPGFLIPDLRQEVSDIIRSGIRSRVTVSALDARGLWTDPAFDASVGHTGGPSAPASQSRRGGQASLPTGFEAAQIKSAINSAASFVAADAIAEISAGTGGRLFANSNDLAAGLQQIAAAPECVYMLAFSPAGLKADGRYHNIKVTLKDGRGLSVDARKGYFAPTQFSTPVEQSKNDVRDAVFSRDILSDLPVEVTAQFSQRDGQDGQIAVFTRLYPQALKLRKADGRNYDQVRIMCSVFDPNGQYIKAIQQVVELEMRDAVLEQSREKGVVFRTDIDVKPGKYLVRVVIHDVEGNQTSARNVTVGEAGLPRE
jgi:VWFA-related protein